MRWLVLALALLGCRDEPAPKQRERVAPQRAPQVAPTTAPDPWQTKVDPTAPPDLGQRHKLADEACPSVAGPYFFAIEKHGKVSHILGTRHVGVALAKFPAVVMRAIESAKLAVFEVAPDDHIDIPQRELLLSKELGPDLWSRYEKLVGDQVASAVERGTPSSAMLAMMVMYEDIGSMLDMEIEHEVAVLHMPARGLETSAFQDRLLNKLLDLRMLRAAIEHTKDRAELADESKKDLREYCAGTDDSPGMDDDMRNDMLDAGYTNAELDKIDEEMVYARNAKWIPKLEEILARGDVFIAVGADHLIGPRGVVALLEKRGYKLTRITK